MIHDTGLKLSLSGENTPITELFGNGTVSGQNIFRTGIRNIPRTGVLKTGDLNLCQSVQSPSFHLSLIGP